MRMRRLITALIGAICILATVFAVGALAADGGCVVSLSTENKLEQGSGGYASVSIAPSAPLATITVSVHYDESLLTVYDHYNAIGAKLYDASVTDGCIQYTYIFASDSEEISGELFYFYYQINEDARVGEYTLDVTVSEAYSPSLELLDVRGSRSSITVTERKAELYNYIYSDSGIELSVGEETTLSYYVANTEVVGGALDFVYDPELFELVSVEYGGLLDGKVVDCNSSQSGAVYLSFVGTDYSYDNRIASLTLRAIKNLDTETEISLSVSELYDKELRSYKCDGAASAVSINYDPSYVEDAPRMSIGISYDESTGRVIATLKLDRDSHLGAGDFTLSFNPELLSFISAEKGFSPSFFNVNDKKISDGILKLSIISLTDITDETTVLTVSFEAKSFCEARLAELGLTGSSLTDSMTVPILLNLTGASLSLPEKHTPAEAVTENRTEPNCTTDGKYDSVVYCSVCKEELTRVTEIIPKLGHKPAEAVTENRTEPNCTTDGKYDSVVYCSVCKEELTRVTEIIPKLGHKPAEAVTENRTEPNCTTDGKYDSVVYCSVCKEELTRVTEIVPKLGHKPAEAVIENRTEPTCTTDGKYDSVVYCSVCKEELTRETVTIGALGHTPNTAVTENRTEPNCTTDGKYDSVVYCSVCKEELTRVTEIIPKLGHKPTEAVTENRTEPNCTTDGKYDSVIYCSVCKEELTRVTEIIPKPGHNYSAEWTVDLEPTCTEKGSKSHHCTRCGDKAEITEIAAKGHSFGDWTETKAPTCTESGEEARECSVCKTIEKQAVSALGHTSGTAVTENRTEPTCTTDGKYDSVVYCSVCKEELTRVTEIIPKLGHKPAEAVIENCTEPTCTTDGKYDSVVYCSVCKEELTRVTEIIPKLGHNHSAEWTVDLEPTCTEKGSKSHHCTRCGDKADITEIAAKGHSFGDWLETKAPTCTESGEEARECSVCKTIEKQAINALGHTPSTAVIENRTEPTCTTDGKYDSVVYCSVCKEELTRVTEIIPKLGHDYSAEWTVDLEPTCTEKGSKSHHCTRCGDKADITEIAAKGHAFGDWIETKAPTCTEAGEEARECSVCKTIEKQAVSALGHTPGTTVTENRTEPNCTTDGKYDSVVYCSVCKEELTRVTEIIPKLGHKPAEAVTENRTEPTCTTDGKCDSVVYCSVCNEELTRVTEIIPKLGHDYSPEWTVDLEPTCTEKGSKSHHCTRCGDKAEITEIAAKGHAFGDWTETKAPTCTESGEEARECSVCKTIEKQAINALGHTPAEAVTENRTEPNCTTDGKYDSVVYCSVCKEELTRETVTIGALGHTPNTAVTENRTEPNCTTDGKYDSVVYCSVCKEELTRETVTIGALGHTPSAAVIENRTEPNCTTDGKYDSVIYCSVCKEELTRVTEIIPKLGHDYSAEWTVDLEPTCTEKGSKSHHCTRCGDKAKITEIAANGHTFGEYTSNGDATYDADGTKSAVCSNCGATDTQPDEGTALGETARFEDTVNALLPIDRAPSYSELREAIVIYQRLDGGERESVAETYAKLVKMVEDYNNRVGEINTATDEATEAAFAPLALMGYAFLAALLAILKKLLSR